MLQDKQTDDILVFAIGVADDAKWDIPAQFS